MCGISGVVSDYVESHLLSRMTDAIAHRGPDGSGTWISPCSRVGLGHRRLSIVDLSDAGSQPMSNLEGDLTIVFNGEIYNHIELRQQLPENQYQGHSDTEVILAAYKKWGVGCLEKFNGMFAFALWDAKRQELFCARDRLGVKPFFYSKSSNQLIFGSEVKALIASGMQVLPNADVWARYLCFGSFEGPGESFFSGVNSLPPGHYMIVKPNGECRLKRWWSLPERVGNANEFQLEDATAELSRILDAAVALRSRSDVPVALNLTGGLDSSSVAQSFLRQNPFNKTHIFTAAFNDAKYDEDVYADLLLSKYQCERHVTRISPEEIPNLAAKSIWSQEAPFGGIGMLAYESIHREMGSMGLKVSIEGQGGDELFAGYNYFQPLRLLDLLEAGDWKSALAFSRNLFDRKNVANLARRISNGEDNFYQDGTNFLSLDCISLDVRSIAKAIVYDAPFENRTSNALFRDLTETKLQRVLRMNDRLSMAYGVELRQPFLDWRMVEFATKLPVHWKIRDGLGKYILRLAMNDRLPKEIVWEKKRAVVTPQREWMTGPLKEWIMDIISSRSFNELGFFNQAKVKSRFDLYVKNGSDNAFPIWQWINTVLWFDAFIKG